MSSRASPLLYYGVYAGVFAACGTAVMVLGSTLIILVEHWHAIPAFGLAAVLVLVADTATYRARRGTDGAARGLRYWLVHGAILAAIFAAIYVFIWKRYLYDEDLILDSLLGVSLILTGLLSFVARHLGAKIVGA